jgi:hypothetical protein
MAKTGPFIELVLQPTKQHKNACGYEKERPPSMEEWAEVRKHSQVGKQEEHAEQDENKRYEERLPKHVTSVLALCGLTFELSGPRRHGAWAARRMLRPSG